MGIKRVFLSAILMLAPAAVWSAEVGSVANSRFGTDWTLDGSEGIDAASKLTNPVNFGPAGTVTEAINITHTADEITLGLLSGFDVFFIGWLDDSNVNAFTANELTAMSDYVNAGGVMVITCDDTDHDAVCTHFGFPTSGSQSVNPVTPTAAGAVHPIFNGPFGTVTSINMTGNYTYFGSVGSGTVLGQDNNDDPVVLVANLGAGTVIAYTDIDLATSYGEMSTGDGIINQNDEYWGNIFAFAIGQAGIVSTTANFKVTKTFSDGSDDEVDVHLTCNSGVPLEQDFTIAGGDPAGVTFVVQDIPASGANCEVTESGGPAGYTPVLNAGDGCAWEGVTSGHFECAITNEANPATFIVNKEWYIENGSADDVNEEALVTVYCNNEIVGGSWNGNAYVYGEWLSGDDSLQVSVDTTQQSAQCYAVEEVNQTGIESDSDCGTRSIAAGGSSSCTFTNTVFFEGIPTLSQWGLAILAVLTLGVGLVGFRRFA